MEARTPVRDVEPNERVKSFIEVCKGYNAEEAVKEANRCLQCKKPLCVQGCPVNIDIPEFIREIKEERFDEAVKIIKRTNSLPAVCGRVCPQEKQCEEKCIVGIKGEPIAIGKLERFVADNESKKDVPNIRKNGKKVAVVGSGPAGLSCAADLALKGYKVTIFEALHDAGGVLKYGIPEFRLPNDVVEKEIDYVRDLGVKIKTNYLIGKTIDLKSLLKDFDAVFIGSGAGLPYFMNIPGEHLRNVYSANEFLTRVNLMKANDQSSNTPVLRGKKTVVIGAGNVAMDAARVARRLGSEVTIVYRRSFSEMPARHEEIVHAKEEGIRFMLLTNPTKILGDAEVEGIECVQMKLSDSEVDGRRVPLPIEDSEFVIECDQVIVAIGQGPNPLIAKTSDVMAGGRGNIIVDEKGATNIEGVYAGGDIVSGAATVIKAMGDGKKAAEAISEYLNKGVENERD